VGEVYAQTGRCAFDGGPGVTDGVTGVANAYLANSPVLVIGERLRLVCGIASAAGD